MSTRVKQKGDGWVQVPVDKRLLNVATALWEPGIRCYQKDLAGVHLNVLVALNCEPGPNSPRWHLSIALRTNEHPPRPGPRLPDWYEIKEARYKFVPEQVTMALLLPPPEQFVNLHDTTMQLWEIDPR